MVADKIAESQFLSAFAGEGLQSVRHLHIQLAEVLPDVLQHVLPGETVKLNGATGREVREILLNFLVDGKAVPWEERFQLGIDPVAAVGLADEVEHGEAVLTRCMTQAAAELLEEDGQALRGAEEQHRVDFRHIHPFAELIDGKEEGEPAVFELGQQFLASPIVNAGDKGSGWNPHGGESLGHELGMFDRDTETDPFNAAKIGLVAMKCCDDGIDPPFGADVIQHLHVFQGRGIVLAVAPELLPVDGDWVGNAEIMEWAEKLFFQGLR